MNLAERLTLDITELDTELDSEKCCNGGLCSCLAACTCNCPACVC